MRQESSVLMVCGGGELHLALRKVLNEAGMQVRLVQSCAEVQRTLEEFSVPAALFSDTSLPDGTWADILALATQGARQVPVIVVSRVVDINLYINVLEKGASDFIVPPFYCQDILHVLKCSTQASLGVQALAA